MHLSAMNRSLLTVVCLSTSLCGFALNATADHGIDIAGMDRTVVVKSPGDMQNFANGNWFDNTPIPADKAYVGTYDEIRERNLATLRSVLENPTSTLNGADAGLKFAKSLYRQAMNERALETSGSLPVAAELKRIDLVKDRNSLATEIAHLHTLGVPVAFDISVSPDDKNNTRHLLTLAQGGQILPERNLYLATDERSVAMRAQYLTTVGKLLAMVKVFDPASRAKEALELETLLANASLGTLDLKDPQANYHRKSLTELEQDSPEFGWSAYFTGLGVESVSTLNVRQPKFFAAFSKALAERPIAQWRSYLRASTLYAWAPYLANAFVKTQFSLSSNITGCPLLSPRWKRAIATVDLMPGDILGHILVAKSLNPDAQKAALRVVNAVRIALRERLVEVDWMLTETQALAVKKLDGMKFKIGSPGAWEPIPTFKLSEESLLDSILKIQSGRWKSQLALLKKPLDRSAWTTSAADIRVSYNLNLNELTVPAGALQKGLFDPYADDASNFGAIGSVIGHEITHGFDNYGSQFDATGNLKNWWKDEDWEHYTDASSHVRIQYTAYRSPDGVPVDGKLTLSENCADIGGLSLAYAAYHRVLGGATPRIRDGLSGDQRFFIAFTQTFRSHYRPDVAQALIATDLFAPDTVRAVGAISDEKGFYKAFGLSVPKTVPHIW